ncbi:helicase [Bradyrhizobium ontarionense]|uniref:Helicase n=1 Tax=Bradyrhizobium ontarionense TaxID=2898149 RepID=A0ABY3RKC4_9BRAD|nr:helicase [Bradyrhizobium sp. A19]UFZ07869.1 helicase [Bradyrhizobium sp. A19]
MNAVHRLEPAVGPLQNVLGYLTKIVRHNARVVERLSDHRLGGGHRFVFHQHELEKLPGITQNTFDADGPVWLSVERLVATDPPAVISDLAMWIEVSADPDRRPLVRQRVTTTVHEAEKDRLIAAGHARAEHCSPAIAHDASARLWNVRLHLEQRPDIVERLDRYLADSWAAWATAERPRRQTIAVHRRLREMARVAGAGGSDRSCEIVWGVGVSRWRRQGHELDLPLLERLVEIEVLENSDSEIRIRPRMVGATVNLAAFEALTSAATLAGDNAERLLETIERGGELSPFQPESFEPILSAISSQLDPQGIYRPTVPDSAVTLQDASDQLTVSDRWVIFARPRSDALLLRDIARLKRAMEYAPGSECCLDALAHLLLGAPDHEAKDRLRRRLSGVIGDPIDIAPVAQVTADQGDLFFPLPTNSDQMEIVRQLRRSDGLVVQGARGPDRTAAIANLVCHHLALGLRVLVVSRNESALAHLSEKLPRAIRELTVELTGSDKQVLKHAETVVSRLLSIVDTMDLRAQAEQINRLERDIIATSYEISRLDDDVADIASRSLPRSSGASDLPPDALTTLIADRDAYAWFTDRPSRFLSETDLLASAVDQASQARLRLAGDLKYVDDDLPEIASLPDAATVMRLHKDLQSTAERLDGESRDSRLTRDVIATLGSEEADKLAGDLDALAAAHRVIADDPWLAALSPVGAHADETSVDGAALVDFARDASSLLSRRAGFLARPVETPADAFANQELLTIVERLSVGERPFATFSLPGRGLKQTVDAITLAGFAPKTAADWGHVRDYLTWRRHLHSLNARWRLLAAEIGAPTPEPESSHTFHGHERIIKCVEVAIVMAALAKRNVLTTVPKLSMPDGEVAELLGDGRRLTALAAAVRNAASRLAHQRSELTRLNQLFSGCGALAADVEADVLSQIGRDDVDPREIEKRWIAIRSRLQALHDRRQDVELLDEVCRTLTEAGAGEFARRIRSEPADQEGGDPVLVADWIMAWNWAVLMRQTDGVGQHQRLRDLSDQRVALEMRLRELLEQVVVARMHLGFAQNTSSNVRQALTVFMITLRKMAATCSGPTACRLRQVAREALESCYEGIPCQLMPAWRVAEQLPARLGAFDLVVIDDASQSDLRELTAMLRGRKVVVIEDDRRTGEIVEQADRSIEAIEHAVLRSVPVAIRQFLLPGAALCDLVKLLFPDRMIRLREHARRVDPVALPSTASWPQSAEPQAPSGGAYPAASALAGSAEGHLPSMSSAPRPAYSLEDEIATVAESLSFARASRGQRDEPTISMEGPAPDWLSNRTGGSTPSNEARGSARGAAHDEPAAAASAAAPAPPAWLQPAVSVTAAGNETHHGADRLADSALSPLDDAPAAATVTVVANEAERPGKTETRPASEPVRRPAGIDHSPLSAPWRPRLDDIAKRPRRSLRRRVMAAAAVVAVMMVATSIYYWQPAANRITTSWHAVLNQLPVSWNAASPAAALAAGTEPRKVTAERMMPNGKSAAGGDGAAEAIMSHAVLYQEDPQDPHGKRYLGTVTWHVEPAAGSVPASIKGDVEIDKRMKATLSLRPNLENEMPASHLMEVKFNWPDDPTHVGVDSLKGVSMKARESGRGAPLSALTAKVTPEFFMIALSAGDVDTKRNVLLLKGKEWIDIPIVYSGGSRAVLAIEKGADGERAFKDAFAAWGQ